MVAVADSFLRQVRFGRDGAESTTKAYAGSIALFLRWCSLTSRRWQSGIEQLGLFMTWLLHAGPLAAGAGASAAGGMALDGAGGRRLPGRPAGQRGAAAVRGMVVHAVAAGRDPGIWCRCSTRWPMTGIFPMPSGARTRGRAGAWRPAPAARAAAAGGPGRRRGHRCSARRVPVGPGPADRAADGAGRAPPGRGAGAAPQRRAPAGRLPRPGCGWHGRICTWCAGRTTPTVPLPSPAVSGPSRWTSYGPGVRHLRVPADAGTAGRGRRIRDSEPVPGAGGGADAAGRGQRSGGRRAQRAGLQVPPTPHQLRHAFASNVLDAGGLVDEAQELLGHASVSSTEIYTHPDPARLRAAVDAVPSPRELAGETR